MSLDLLIPFLILLILIVYLIYSRSKFEKEIVDVYEEKLEEWKKHATTSKKDEVPVKKLAGLVYKTGYKVSIELIDESATGMLEKGKFEISDIKKDK